VRPSSAAIPDCFETGTKNHEAIAGIAAAVDYLAALGRDLDPASGFDQYESGRRRWLKQAMAVIMEHESLLFLRLLAGLQAIPGLRLLGISDPARLNERTPTACFTLPGLSPAKIAESLGQEGIQVWDGDYYAWEAMNFLGLGDRGGAVRAGLSMYNTEFEVNRFLEALSRIAR
jgi:selenocysteine lyase/cysteine desulfurase